MTSARSQAIVGGYHGDPFLILGPHMVHKRGGEQGWEVRAFLPQAESAEDSYWRKNPAHDPASQGWFFVALLTGDQQPYRILLALYGGGTAELEDPYRFPPALIGLPTCTLHSEGTNNETYRMSGRAPCRRGRRVRRALRGVGAQCGERHLTGEFNEWDTRRHPMRRRNGGVWEIFVPGLGDQASYKYNVRSRLQGYQQLKADPYAFYCETAAEIGVVRLGHRQVRVAGRRVDGGARQDRLC